MTIQFFTESMHDVFNSQKKELAAYVKKLPDDDFQIADRSQMCELIAAKFGFPEPPTFGNGPITMDEPLFNQGSEQVFVVVDFPFSGNPTQFALYHSSSPVPTPRFELKGSVLQKTYRVDKRDMERMDEFIDADVKKVEGFQKLVRDMVPRYNKQLCEFAQQQFDARVREINENKQAAGKLAKSKYTIRKRAGDAEQIIVPVQRKPITPARTAASPDAIQEYVLSLTEYDDVLKTISSMVKVMERTPSVFAAMNEEPLRTILLVALNGLYEGDAMAETFNGTGKTDILIRRQDSNVFIAECLLWKGQAYLQKKMDDQLFKYAMWRDSKLALIIFNRGGDFTKTIETMKATIKAHPQCVNQINWSHESGARYLFRRHDDPARNFVLTALAFDVPQ